MRILLAMLAGWTFLWAAGEEGRVTFAFGGDVMMGTTYPDSMGTSYLPKADGANLFRNVKELLRQADVAAANLEGPMLDGAGSPSRCRDPKICYTFRQPTRYVDNLVDAGIDFMSIANNHSNDMGPEGIASTVATLDKAGIAHSGIRGVSEAAVIERAGRKIGFLAFGFSRRNLSLHDVAYAKGLVDSLARNCDIVVCSVHNGAEGAVATRVTRQNETAFGGNRGNVYSFVHALVDAGADVVYGHGPHVVRGAELYKDRLILYSLGNFVTPYRFNLRGISGHAPVVTVVTDAEGRFIEGKVHSFVQQRGVGPVPDATGAAAKQIERLSKLDFPESALRFTGEGVFTK